jgi:hypothetical protein
LMDHLFGHFFIEIFQISELSNFKFTKSILTIVIFKDFL